MEGKKRIWEKSVEISVLKRIALNFLLFSFHHLGTEKRKNGNLKQKTDKKEKGKKNLTTENKTN